jgi:dihydrofolate synthase/folylpolyglutamate synthase
VPYTELVQWMFNLERFGIKLGLDNMKEFMSRIGNPQNDFKSVHVSGTNGKGSTCAFIASILSQHGLRTGLYTSPHLVDFRERIVVDGKMISESDVVRLGNELRTEMEAMADESAEKQLTFFEFTTGLAFKYFSEVGVDMAVIEVGMGGRLDATNLVMPEVTAITRIGLEHTAYLGRTLKEIAREKAGIIKEGVPTVTCEREPVPLAVISSTCATKVSPMRRIGRDFSVKVSRADEMGTEFDYEGARSITELRIPLVGEHQAENAALAVAACEELGGRGISVSDQSVRNGLSEVVWPARLDIWSRNPLVIIDGSHNPEGVSASSDVLKRLGLTPITYVVACMSDKDAEGIVRALASTAERIIVTEVKIGRSAKASDIGTIATRECGCDVEVVAEPEKAFYRALRSDEGQGTCIVGSFYLAGEAMKWLEGEGGLPRAIGRTRGGAHKV